VARRKAQTYGVRGSSSELRRAPLGAPHALVLMRYRASRYLSAWSRRATSAHAHFATLSAAGRALRCRRNAGRSASSWQGFVVSPGGAPMPPEGLVAYEPRRRRAPSRLTTPHERALRRTRWGGV
jgi:hypothetical protein